ncbi:2-oxoglutarate-dependent ethylene/succinate-forming enzyme [Marinomonas aquimarina]|uniref:2-oxoglutarate-dependent ethylene/succinate-forming enzyme n=1 Tax=Marinomonas aquimarina TaxID=295068 RepID=A0A1A8THM0_9GAMM|nr:2-oxoglutarate and iron-dependent oxygenase domain-containing protein [Marinomonas aquimarina]SBS32175.1 2-oxoglutarate-dependent ethylene/succinate-forming enzyme [Marinomonas aquimarina]
MSIELHSYLNAEETEVSSIPVVDVSTLIDGSDPDSVANKIGDVCENLGFLYIVNHGVSKELMDKVKSYTEQFFDLPLEEKQKLNIENSGETLRGYIPMFGENVDPDYTQDFKECFDYAHHEESVSPFFGPNLMPESIPGFKETMEEYHAQMLKLANKLIGAIALSLGLPFDYFYKLQQKPISIQRILHYPPQTGQITRDKIGIGEHTDYGFLTILSQDAVGGLQVKNRAGKWISAPPIEGSFIVNIGDLVQTYTNDKYISTYHRVINTSGKERYSYPFFLDMDFNAVVEPVPTCVTDANPAKYKAYTCGEHKFRRFVDSYAHLQVEKSA